MPASFWFWFVSIYSDNLRVKNKCTETWGHLGCNYSSLLNAQWRGRHIQRHEIMDNFIRGQLLFSSPHKQFNPSNQSLHDRWSLHSQTLHTFNFVRTYRYKIIFPNKSTASHRSSHASHPDQAIHKYLQNHVKFSSQIKAGQTDVMLAEKNEKSIKRQCARHRFKECAIDWHPSNPRETKRGQKESRCLLIRTWV